jgi:hypothetical protein
VSLEVPAKNKHYQTPLQRYTLSVESPAALADAHRELDARREDFALTSVEAINEIPGGQSFLVCDLDRNWWEVAYLTH